jgi:hypothetical protein
MYADKIKIHKIILGLISISLLMFPFGVQKVLGKPPAAKEESALERAIDLIKEYDEKGNIERLRVAIADLRTEKYKKVDPYLVPYFLSEAEVKELIYLLKSSPKDSLLSSQARSRIRELWLNVKKIEEFHYPETSAEAKKKREEDLKNLFERGASTIIEAARFFDYSNSLGPLIKNIIDRAERYDFMKGTHPGAFSDLQVAKEFSETDYPNAAFLSNIMKADWFDNKAQKIGQSNTSEESESDSLRREAASLAQAAFEAATTPYAKCIGYYLAARNMEVEQPEEAVKFYNQAIVEFDNFTGATEGYIGKKFNKPVIRADFVEFIYRYGKSLVEKEDFIRYVALLENGWRLKGLEEGIKYPLATHLNDAYSKLITQLKEEKKDGLVEGYMRKQQKIDAYINVHK